MLFFGFVKLFIFLFFWVFSVAVVPVSIILFFFEIRYPAYILVVYYSFRAFFPPKRSDFVINFFSSDDTPYCRTTSIIFDGNAKPPDSNDRNMIAAGPHGILTLGWTFLTVSKLFFNSDTKWLVANALMYLPFISDLMTWGNCDACVPKVMSHLMKQGTNIGLLPGGFQEVTIFKHGHYRLYIKKRKGFIKVIT